jgi:hypothetical protein
VQGPALWPTLIHTYIHRYVDYIERITLLNLIILAILRNLFISVSSLLCFTLIYSIHPPEIQIFLSARRFHAIINDVLSKCYATFHSHTKQWKNFLIYSDPVVFYNAERKN